MEPFAQAQAWISEVMEQDQWHLISILRDGDTTRARVHNVATGERREKTFPPDIDITSRILAEAAADPQEGVMWAPNTTPTEDINDLKAVVKASDNLVVAERELNNAVARARSNGRSWGNIAAALGISIDEAKRRFDMGSSYVEAEDVRDGGRDISSADESAIANVLRRIGLPEVISLSEVSVIYRGNEDADGRSVHYDIRFERPPGGGDLTLTKLAYGDTPWT